MDETVGYRIKKARNAKKMTRRELAKITGLHENSIARYELDLNGPTLLNSVCLAEVLGVSLEYLAGLPEYEDEVKDVYISPEDIGVVYCKDCKYSKPIGSGKFMCKKYMCGIHKGMDYCSKGAERD